MTNQPIWKIIANLGDANPIDHGGYFISIDTTGIYSPEAELLVVPEQDNQYTRLDTWNENYEDHDNGHYRVYRFILEKCTYQNGILSDNRSHPDYPAWFAKPEDEKIISPHARDWSYLSDLCERIDLETNELIRLFCSENPIELAIAYREIGQYHGFDNFDSYPLDLSRTEVEERYAELTISEN